MYNSCWIIEAAKRLYKQKTWHAFENVIGKMAILSWSQCTIDSPLKGGINRLLVPVTYTYGHTRLACECPWWKSNVQHSLNPDKFMRVIIAAYIFTACHEHWKVQWYCHGQKHNSSHFEFYKGKEEVYVDCAGEKLANILVLISFWYMSYWNACETTSDINNRMKQILIWTYFRINWIRHVHARLSPFHFEQCHCLINLKYEASRFQILCPISSINLPRCITRTCMWITKCTRREVVDT